MTINDKLEESRRLMQDLNTNEKLEETRKVIKHVLGKLDEIEEELSQPDQKAIAKADLKKLAEDTTMFLSRAFMARE